VDWELDYLENKERCEEFCFGNSKDLRTFKSEIGMEEYVKGKIQRRILAGNRTYFAAISLFRSRLLSRSTKIILYKTLIRQVVSYGAEAWTLTKKEEQDLLIFERKIFRRIYGPKYENW